MTFFSKRTDWPSEPNRLALLTGALRRKGRSFVDLTNTNPTACDFKTLGKYFLSPFLDHANLTYEPNSKGHQKAREAISGYYAGKKIQVSPERILVTSTTSEAYTFLFKLLLNSGESAAVPAPSYPLLDTLAGLSDVAVSHYRLAYADRWRLVSNTLPQNKKIKAVCVINPNNPTGNFLCEEDKTFLNRYCADKSCALISDEVFLDFPLGDDAELFSLAGNRDALTFTLSGISKILGLPQMKLSWIVVNGPEAPVREALRRLEIIADAYLSVCAPSQNALAKWFEQRHGVQNEILTRTRNNYAFLKKTLASQKSGRVLTVEGGWQAVVRLEDKLDDEKFSLGLLERGGVLVHPGYLYDFEEGQHLVVSLLPSPEDFQKGVLKISAFLDNPSFGS